MDIFTDIGTFVTWFGNVVIRPLFALLDSASVLGFTLWEWFIGFAVIGLAIRFFKAFLGLGFHSDKTED